MIFANIRMHVLMIASSRRVCVQVRGKKTRVGEKKVKFKLYFGIVKMRARTFTSHIVSIMFAPVAPVLLPEAALHEIHVL